MRDIVLASGNAGKIREIEVMLAPLGLRVVPQSRYAVSKVDEPHPTFIENALRKARHASSHTGLPALAEDSGVCVAALGGAPGVQSARFAGEPRSDERNNERLLQALANATERRAHYCCVMVLLRGPADPQPLVAQGEWHGEILAAARGTGGFGYDPLFFDPALGKTGAQLSVLEKNRVSHRGKALAALVEQLGAMPLR